ncbi:hypothetical protein [Rhodococcus triatomae]
MERCTSGMQGRLGLRGTSRGRSGPRSEALLHRGVSGEGRPRAVDPRDAKPEDAAGE